MSIEDMFRDAELNEVMAATQEKKVRAAEIQKELVAIQELKKSQFWPYFVEWMNINNKSLMHDVTNSIDGNVVLKAGGALKLLLALQDFVTRDEALVAELESLAAELKGV